MVASMRWWAGRTAAQGVIHSQMDAKACKIDGEALLIEDDKQMAPEGDILMFRMIMIYVTAKRPSDEEIDS